MRDPQQYARFSDERSRPFFSLLERVPDGDYREIVDLGCGSGVLTQALAERWPQAHVLGLDYSEPMLAGAGKYAIPGRLDFEHGNIEDYDHPADLIFSNAALQWVGDHESLIPRLASLVRPNGVLAVQMPFSHPQPSHLLMEQVARSGPWAAKLAHWKRFEVKPLGWYAGLLLDAGFSVDAWETAYHSVLQGDDPVLEWVKGSGLQPILNLLDDDERAAFTADYAALLREAYPRHSYGTIYPFSRIFFVATRA